MCVIFILIQLLVLHSQSIVYLCGMSSQNMGEIITFDLVSIHLDITWISIYAIRKDLNDLIITQTPKLYLIDTGKLMSAHKIDMKKIPYFADKLPLVFRSNYPGVGIVF